MATRKKDGAKTRPAAELKSGMVKAVAWPNETAKWTRYSVTFQRLYREDDTWKSTQSFNTRDLGDVVRVAVQAEAWIREHGTTSTEAA